jgi:saccharopine dehydrogenase-like NADP-dependent oxidoreductase
MAFLMNELRLNDRRAVLKDILESAVPVTPQDVVLIFCTVSGWKDGRLTQVTDARKIYHGACPLVAGAGRGGGAGGDGAVAAEQWSAIQMTTASSLCAVLDLHVTGKFPDTGFVRQEQVALDDFLANRFGRCYATGQDATTPAGAVARV